MTVDWKYAHQDNNVSFQLIMPNTSLKRLFITKYITLPTYLKLESRSSCNYYYIDYQYPESFRQRNCAIMRRCHLSNTEEYEQAMEATDPPIWSTTCKHSKDLPIFHHQEWSVILVCTLSWKNCKKSTLSLIDFAHLNLSSFNFSSSTFLFFSPTLSHAISLNTHTPIYHINHVISYIKIKSRSFFQWFILHLWFKAMVRIIKRLYCK